jgi:integrase
MTFLSATLGRILPRYRTVAEWADTYAKLVCAKPIQDKTKANRASYLKRIVAQFGSRHIGAVRPHEIAAFIAEIHAQHPHLARRMLIELREMFREAVNYGWIDRDPCHGIRTPRVRVVRLRLTLDQWFAMHDYAQRKQPPWVACMLLLAVVTGQRRGDMRKMRFSDVWDELVDGEPVPHLHVEQEKTGTRIAIPLHLRLHAVGTSVGEAIEACRQYSPAPAGEDAWLLRKSTGRPPVGPSMSWRFEQALEMTTRPRDRTADTDPPSLHECRSLAARLYHTQGVADIQTLLGHSHASMTELYKDDRGLDRRGGKWRTVSLERRPGPVRAVA